MCWEVKIEVIVRRNFPKCITYHPNIPVIPNTDPKLRLEDYIMKIHKIYPSFIKKYLESEISKNASKRNKFNGKHCCE